MVYHIPSYLKQQQIKKRILKNFLKFFKEKTQAWSTLILINY